MKFYTGIGSRQTPQMDVIHAIAHSLQNRDYTLRSGGAEGADSQFERGIVNKEIYLPWRNFNGNTSRLFNTPDAAFEIAAKYHPAWDRLSQGARRLHARNVLQVLGQDLQTPSEFVICWTSDGKDSGGTGQALRIARAYDIPVYNLYNEREKIIQFVKQLQ